MPRSKEETRRRARKYGRRHRLGEARGSAKELAKVVKGLLRELRASAVPQADREELQATLAKASDVTRRNRAIWAIVHALERVERD